MPDPLTNFNEIFSAPLESIIEAVGQGITKAQSDMDRNSLATQDLIDSDPLLAGLGIQATWYQFPKVDLQLKLSMTVAEDKTVSGSSGGGPRTRLYLQPVSAAFQNHFNYTADASSTLSLSIVPVPPPSSGAQGAVAPQLQPADAQAAAFSSKAKFFTVKDSKGNTVPDPKFRLDMNYNAGTGTWFVLQYDATNRATTPVIVAVDDRTKQTRVISTP